MENKNTKNNICIHTEPQTDAERERETVWVRTVFKLDLYTDGGGGGVLP